MEIVSRVEDASFYKPNLTFTSRKSLAKKLAQFNPNALILTKILNHHFVPNFLNCLKPAYFDVFVYLSIPWLYILLLTFKKDNSAPNKIYRRIFNRRSWNVKIYLFSRPEVTFSDEWNRKLAQIAVFRALSCKRPIIFLSYIKMFNYVWSYVNIGNLILEGDLLFWPLYKVLTL